MAEQSLREVAPSVRSVVERTVEQDVIPRMLLARRGEAAAAVSAPSTVSDAQVDELIRLVLARHEAEALAYVRELHATGVPTEALYLDLLAAAARQLGQLWIDDECDFTDVTVGMFLLQAAMRDLRSAFGSDGAFAPDAHRALLVPLPGEQHTFGLSMVADFFRRAGWNATSGPVDSDQSLTSMVRGAWFDVIGFSLACDEQVDDARRVIGMVRAASRNPGVVIMIGGPGFIENPALAASVGADGTACDGLQAVKAAASLVGLAARRTS